MEGDTVRFLQAANYTPVAHRSINLIVMHDMEVGQAKGVASSVAEFFHNQHKGSDGSSAHYCFDRDEGVHTVHEHDVAWAAPYANHDGLHYELAGRASQDKRVWLDDYSLAMLDLVAQHTAHRSHFYRIPVRHLKAADLRAGLSGFTGHRDVTEAFGPVGGHTDPGPDFPWQHFLNRVREFRREIG